MTYSGTILTYIQNLSLFPYLAINNEYNIKFKDLL